MIICEWCNMYATTTTATSATTWQKKGKLFLPQMFPVYTISFRFGRFSFVLVHSFPFHSIHPFRPFYFICSHCLSHSIPESWTSFISPCSYRRFRSVFVVCASWIFGWRHIIETILCGPFAIYKIRRAITSLQMYFKSHTHTQIRSLYI